MALIYIHFQVLDYGCGEASVLSFLIPSTDDPVQITKLAGLDICPKLLEEAVQACQPWKEDYECLREQPLTIDIYKGKYSIIYIYIYIYIL